MDGQQKKRQVSKIVVFVISVFVICISVSYALVSQIVTSTKEVVINAGTLDLVLEEENAITINNAFPLADEVGLIQEDVFKFRLVNKSSNLTNYVLKLLKVGTGTLDDSLVKYGLIKENEKKVGLVSNITDNVIDEGTIAGSNTINYELRFWLDSSITDETLVSGKSASYKIDVEANQEIVRSPSSVDIKLFASENLGSNCKTYDDGVDTFLVGQCSNNYVWYSGKLWRVVLKNNETGAVKMVTDNAITTMQYNDSSQYTGAFKDTYMDQWLNQEFLPTLHDYEDYLVTDSIWDATAIESLGGTPSRPTYVTSVTRTVGLLNSYEYYTTYNKSDGLASSSTGYLKNSVEWWLMTPYNQSAVRSVDSNGSLDTYAPRAGRGARPSVNLKSDIQISGGSGIKSNPYMLEGDIKKPVNGTTLLSTRYSGEYITFNNELYRIVDIENGLTKITAVDKISTLSGNVFDSSTDATANFTNASIKTDLENYYQGLKTTNEAAYNMIEPNTTWYLGEVGDGVNYKASICATVDTTKSMKECTNKAVSTTASIGLPRLGEMFTSQITRGTKANFWTLTPYNQSIVRIVDVGGILSSFETTFGYDVRPSMYLKSEIKIASSNTGNGTYEKPYSLSMN